VFLVNISHCAFDKYNLIKEIMNKKEYLRRIGIDKPEISPDLENLRLLQRQHLLRIPFENLDIHWERPIALDNEAFYAKIVGDGRGGFCYELNGLFYELLGEIGFESKIISLKVSRGNGVFSPEFAHMAIITRIDGKEYLVDVGFGEFIAEPLKFVLEVEQTDENGVFLIRKYDENYFEVVKKDAGVWRSECIFTTLPRELKEFSGMCDYQQTSPESNFTKRKICSLMTESGRKTLTGTKFIETKNGEKSETDVNSEEEFNQILAREFQIRRS
jgi:N-hydroxyarylamine O-acetyltransferase